MARHYGTAIVPARPYKPRDKAKVEVAVQIAQRWILARLRHETHFSLAYHVDVSDHWYSAPYALAKDEMWSWSTAAMVAVFHGETRVAWHVRSDVRNGHTTDPSHMPEAHG